MLTTNRMQLKVWNDLDDPYNHTDLAANWQRIDDHDHSPSWGKLIQNAGLDINSVAQAQLQDNSVGTNEIINGAVTTAKLADNSVNSAKIIDGSIQGVDIGNQQIGINHMSPAALSAIAPLGMVLSWFRPTTAVPVPAGWVICDGSTIAAHDWGGGPVTIPDMRNRFILGAATAGTGVGAATPPAESLHNAATTGGAHTRVFDHTHTVNGHSHVINDHTHTTTHSHGGITIGSGAFATSGSGAHNHQLRTRGVWVLNGAQAGVDEMMIQAAYVGNVSGGAGDVGVDGSDTVHAHTVPNHSHGIPGEAAGSSGASDRGMTSVGLTTNNNGQPVGGDLRPGFVGLLYIMKVKNPT